MRTVERIVMKFGSGGSFAKFRVIPR